MLDFAVPLFYVNEFIVLPVHRAGLESLKASIIFFLQNEVCNIEIYLQIWNKQKKKTLNVSHHYYYYYHCCCCRSVLVAVFWSAPVLFTYPFPYEANLTCFSLLHFLDVDQTCTTNVSHSNLPFIYKIYPWPGLSMCAGTHTHVHILAHACRNNHPPCL